MTDNVPQPRRWFADLDAPVGDATTNTAVTTTIDIDAIRQRAQAADSGPWRVVEEHGRDIADEAYTRLTIQTAIRHGESREVAEMGDTYHDWASKLPEENAEFIAHARQDIPALLAKVDELTATQDRAAKRIDGLRDYFLEALESSHPGLIPEEVRNASVDLADALADLGHPVAEDEDEDEEETPRRSVVTVELPAEAVAR
ncbi:hypothetical protein [Micromonospora sp. NPDC005113]